MFVAGIQSWHVYLTKGVSTANKGQVLSYTSLMSVCVCVRGYRCLHACVNAVYRVEMHTELGL